MGKMKSVKLNVHVHAIAAILSGTADPQLDRRDTVDTQTFLRGIKGISDASAFDLNLIIQI